jgi:soluble lytic murein transglycosylase
MRGIPFLVAALLVAPPPLEAIARDVHLGRCDPYLPRLEGLTRQVGPAGVRAGLLLGTCWLRLGRIERAIAAFDAVARRPGPLSAYAALWAGELALRMGDRAGGIRRLRRALLEARSDPARLRVHLVLAEHLAPTPQEAEEHARLVLSRATDDETRVRAWIALGRALVAQGRIAGAVRAYATAWWAFPQDPRSEAARTALRELTGGRIPAPPATARLERAHRLTDPREAAEEFVRAIRAGLPPAQEAEAYLRVGLLRMGSPDAVVALERAARFPPLAPRALYWLGAALRATGRPERGRTVWAELTRRYPESPWAARALLSLGLDAEAKGAFDAADRLYDLVARLLPQSAPADEARWRRGWLRYRQGRYAEAERLFLEAAQHFPTTGHAPASLYWAAKSRIRRGVPAHDLLREVAVRFPFAFYGQRARALVGLPEPPPPPPPPTRGLPPDRFLPTFEELALLGFEEDAAREAEGHPTSGHPRKSAGLRGDPAEGSGGLAALRTLSVVRARSGDPHRSVLAAEQVLGMGGGRDRELWTLAYPRAYWPIVARWAQHFALDPLLVLAVMREESRFDPQAVSLAGAVGLLQVLPATAQALAEGIDALQLRDPEVNVRLGVQYLAAQLRAFGDPVLALCAYNAGPAAARRFARDRGADLDEFVEGIPYRETRAYVRRVLESYGIYRWLYR